MWRSWGTKLPSEFLLLPVPKGEWACRAPTLKRADTLDRKDAENLRRDERTLSDLKCGNAELRDAAGQD